MDSLELAARYAYMPNSLSYCGEPSFNPVFRDYLKGNASRKKLEDEMKKFFGHYLYLDLIAKANKKKPFDRDVVEAFWLGNRILENVKHKDLKILILEKFSKKMSRKRAEKLAKNLPEGILPHHSFNPLYINFINPKVPKKVVLYDRCCIRWGRIKKIVKDAAIVEYSQIIRSSNGYGYGKPRKIRVRTSADGITFIKKPKIGDWVAFHWLLAIQKLNRIQLKNLKFYTKIVMDKVRGDYKGAR